ncbi:MULTISPECIES: Xaa-Pro peptidase family protein [unclassified Chelatococcus]|uniref:M24 family metallopeptidase n=1 Tax=unclassified Chelatococcus TaxID=2638111 RepID=UPI001BCD008C|nr:MULTISPECIES: Xaa-Pro peptidase family protein [unclassified Chelatococcus]MBS7699872.1 aminopeptidase P family protein [Chelatococcus sp. YT9]MBX3558782.1 aminopeptidase P family protein [Chelatococcus sp.]
MGYMNRARCAASLKAEGIDALVVVQPENFRYVTGSHPGFLSSWRRAGTQMALVDADVDRPVSVVVADALEGAFRHMGAENVRIHPVWIDFRRLEPGGRNRSIPDCIEGAKNTGGIRPSTYDLDLALQQLRELIQAGGLGRSRLGIEMDFIPANDLAAFKLALPTVEFVDSSALLKRLQLVKSPVEISILRAACELTELGIAHTVEAIEPGLCARDLSVIFQSALLSEVRRQGIQDFDSSWAAFCCGPNASGRGNTTDPLELGHAIKLDCGCSMSGYISDVARTFFLGQASPSQRDLYKVILEAWEAGFQQFFPGNPISKIYEAVQTSIHKAGFTGFHRGHYGHSIGASVWNEEWPYIAANEHMPLEEGMVFAFEVPMYIDGIGALTIEDHIVVSDSGAYSMNKLPREIQEIYVSN